MSHVIPYYAENTERILKERLEILDSDFNIWMDECEAGNTILTKGEIEGLRILAEKNLRFQSRKQDLNPAQRKQKECVHRKMRNALADLNRMVDNGFIGADSYWNPSAYNPNLDSLPYKIEIWHEDFPVHSVGNFVRALVEMFGDEYAIPIAQGIEEGLR
ncbi:MAG: hypothetical protein ACTSPB_26620, partial [Candidatus Thorarchaeota archaeon]